VDSSYTTTEAFDVAQLDGAVSGHRVGNFHFHVYVIRFEGPKGLIFGAYGCWHIALVRLRETERRGTLYMPNYLPISVAKR
jgi:hypothetical protein